MYEGKSAEEILKLERTFAHNYNVLHTAHLLCCVGMGAESLKYEATINDDVIFWSSEESIVRVHRDAMGNFSVKWNGVYHIYNPDKE